MKHILCALLALLLILPLMPAVRADDPAPVEIRTVEDLLAMAEDPNGSYILMNDLDMTGVEWKSLDFSGSFDGNGHALLNLTLSQPGDATPDSYDGNAIAYETSYVGFFGSLSGAVVTNLQLLNVRAVIETDSPVFLAGMAGYMEDSLIYGCTVTGCLELRAHDRMFGIGGVAGYGWGTVEQCKVDVTLICVDTDAATKDEQFLGGIYGTGFIAVDGCDITLDGYISEHGYVHSGGVVGMYTEYPYGQGKGGQITDTSVTGKITFFEDNTNRRAYCKALIGETLISYGTFSGNTTDFQKDERFDYSRELRPETCDAPAYTETIVPSGCNTYGYTLYTCVGCGYSYTDCYTLFSHSITEWTEILAPTTESEGLMTGNCDGCGLEFQQVIEKLEHEPETQPAVTQAPTQAPSAEPEPSQAYPAKETNIDRDRILWLVLAAVLILAAIVIAVLMLIPRRKKPGKFQR